MHWVNRICNVAIVLLALLCIAAIFSIAPFATQDGPAHLTFGNFLGLEKTANPLLFEHYRANDTLNPNNAVYVLVAMLRRLFSPAITESIVQVLCSLGVVASGWFALRQVSAGAPATWLTLLVFPLALSRLFFFGTYNFCLSVAGFLLVIGAFLRLQRQSTLWSALLVGAMFYLAFFAHAAGFVAAGLALGVVVLAQIVEARRAGAPFGTILRAQRLNVLVLLLPLPLVAVALASSGGAPLDYGVSLDRRLLDIGLLEALRVHDGFGKDLATLLLTPLLFGGAGALAWAVWARRGALAAGQARSGAIGALAVFGAMMLLALVFPDTLGGGWIHFQRMALFPYFGAVLCLAYCPVTPRVQAAIAAVAAGVTVVLLGDAVTVQREIARQLRPLNDVDRLVGQHCSVVPVVLSLKPLDDRDRPTGVGYNPFLHVGTKLELTRDRVSLFNYQARTDLYPVRFQEGHDTQALIFNWPPMQRGLGIKTLDLDRFEASSGMAVDYILQWGPLDAASPELRAQVLRAANGAERVYASKDGRVALFRRHSSAPSHCKA